MPTDGPPSTRPIRLPAATRVCPVELVHAADGGPTVPFPLDAAAATPPQQTTLGPIPAPPGYHLLARLGGGGMGEVYLAREHATERTVAMKFLQSPADLDLFERFLIEVRALAKLDHPNIVAIHAADLVRHNPYFTMEYVSGGSLAEWVARHNPVPPADAAGFMATVARAVAVAHAARVIHRDLKPSNILLACPSGTPGPDAGAPLTAYEPKVSDFGVAKRLDRDDKVTVTPQALGTPGYMAPEQVSARYGAVGPATDVHGLGATLYFLLTGRPPIESGPHDEVIRQVTAAVPPRPRSLRPDVPPGLEAVVMKCLAKSPRDRYQTADELADDLDRCAAGTPPLAPQLTFPRRAVRAVGRRWRWVAGVAALVVVAVGLVALGAAARPPRPDPIVPPAADPAAEMARELAAGRPVTLVGPLGLPRFQRPIFGPVALGNAPGGDGVCTFRAGEIDLVELLPDPGVNRYRLTLELRQTVLTPHPDAVDMDRVGFYFGHRVAAAPDGSTLHAMFTVGFRDYPITRPLPGKDPTRQHARFEGLAVRQTAERGVNCHTAWWATVPFTSVGANHVGLWRTVVADVSEHEVHVRWAGDGDEPRTLVRWSDERLRAEAGALSRRVHAAHPTAAVPLPDWHPRQPLGVFADRTVVSVRNAVVTPLP